MILAGDIGGTKTAVLIVDGAQTVVGRGAAPTVTSSPQELVDNIYEAVVNTLGQSNKTVADLLSVGAGVPGMVDPQSGEVRLAVNLNLQAYPLGSALSERFGAPVALENDVRAASLGAYGWLSRQMPLHYMAYLSIGTGISAGVVVDGRLYRGAGAADLGDGHAGGRRGGRVSTDFRSTTDSLQLVRRPHHSPGLRGRSTDSSRCLSLGREQPGDLERVSG